MSLCCNATILKRLVTRSKIREEIELQQGTPEVQKNLQNWKCLANEIINIKNWTNRRRGFVEFSSGCSGNLRSARSRVAIADFRYVCGTSEVHKQGTPEVHLCPVGVLDMYMAPGCLICTSGVPCSSSIHSVFYFL